MSEETASFFIIVWEAPLLTLQRLLTMIRCNPSSDHLEDCVMALQMSEESDSFYIIEEGTVSVEAAFVDIPLAQRAVSFPVNVAAPNNSWYNSLHCSSPCLPGLDPFKQHKYHHAPFLLRRLPLAVPVMYTGLCTQCVLCPCLGDDMCTMARLLSHAYIS